MMSKPGVNVEEKALSLFQPDMVLSAQYWDLFQGISPVEPEKRLMFALLEDAVTCFQRYLFARGEREKELFQEAEDWILQVNSCWLFSFENICEVLGLNPRYICQGLLHWKERELAARPKAKIYRLTPWVRRKARGRLAGRVRDDEGG